jgi:hypothetical protein
MYRRGGILISYRGLSSFFDHTSNDLAVVAFADDQSWSEVSVILEMSYDGEEMLMPSTQKNPSTASKTVHPCLFIFNLHYE